MNSDQVSPWQDYNQKQRMRREQKEITGAIDGFKEAIPSYCRPNNLVIISKKQTAQKFP